MLQVHSNCCCWYERVDHISQLNESSNSDSGIHYQYQFDITLIFLVLFVEKLFEYMYSNFEVFGKSHFLCCVSIDGGIVHPKP